MKDLFEGMMITIFCGAAAVAVVWLAFEECTPGSNAWTTLLIIAGTLALIAFAAACMSWQDCRKQRQQKKSRSIHHSDPTTEWNKDY